MTAHSILEELRPLGRESYKRVLFKHGVREPCFGVKISDLKVFQKRIRKDYQLALDLFDSGNYDAMYLAGLVADDARMTRANLQHWVSRAYCSPLVGAPVPWAASGSPHGWDLALKWIDADRELTAVAGWATLGAIVSIRPDAELDLPMLDQLLARVRDTIEKVRDGVRYQMNDFVISVGSYVAPRTVQAIAVGEEIGEITADLGDNDCQVPFAPDSIRKVEARGHLGKKRKTARC